MHEKIKKLVFYASWLLTFSCKMVFFLIVSIPLRFNKKYKDLWLISERPDEARDNGYWLYKWILENHSEINVKFVLSKDSTDYAKMPRKDLIIKPGSASHYVSYILSSYSISTHMHGACPGKSFVIPFLPLARKKKTVFLQHGIILNSIKLRGGLDCIIASSDREKEKIINSNPNYKSVIYTTGLCRYDTLIDRQNYESEKIILVMPTFRKWLRDIGRLKKPDTTFKETNYYKTWNSFLNSKRLYTILKKNNLKLIFFPHNEIQKLAHNFSSPNDQVTIGKPGEYDVQSLLKKSSILVTDYSSVFFDFVYMDKPVIFYQFDQNDFFAKHYKSSGEVYPFGNICKYEKNLVDEIQETIANNYNLQKDFATETKTFYKHRDRQNCERVFKTIIGLSDKPPKPAAQLALPRGLQA